MLLIAKVVLTAIVCLGHVTAELAPQTTQDSQSARPLHNLSDYLAQYGCTQLIDNKTSIIDDCLRRTLHFLSKYLARLDKGKQFDICRRFDDVQQCLEPILAVCQSFRDKYSAILNPLIRYFKCACSDHGTCMENLHCFEVEYRGILSRRCDDYYKFNVQQQTHSHCFFLQENIACKVALVTTACDWKTGHFAYNLYRFLARHDEKTSRCHVTYVSVENYEGFYYDANCPTYFLQDLASCSTNYLWNEMLAFDEENDLIAKGNSDKVKSSCSAYRSYRKCIRHPRKACKRGTSEVFNYGTSLRKYALKMNYICRNDNKKEYLRSLSCYQDVLQNDTLQDCNYIYKDLKPWLNSVSAYHFYCKETSEETLTMKRHLNRLRVCYRQIFEFRCGEKAAALMNNLIALAFQDPAYLRYSYRPDCRLHRKRSRLKVSRKAGHPDVVGDVRTATPTSRTKLQNHSKSSLRHCDKTLFILFVCLRISWTQLSPYS